MTRTVSATHSTADRVHVVIAISVRCVCRLRFGVFATLTAEGGSAAAGDVPAVATLTVGAGRGPHQRRFFFGGGTRSRSASVARLSLVGLRPLCEIRSLILLANGLPLSFSVVDRAANHTGFTSSL